MKPEEAILESHDHDCAQAEMDEEATQRMVQRQVDKAGLIEWILHYKNPADDETKLRQIKLVME